MRNFLAKLSFSTKVIGCYRNWPQWFLYRLRFYKDQKERVMRLRSGLAFSTRFDLNEPGTVDDIFIRKEYPFPVDEARQYRAVMDIGANIGAFSILAAKLAPSARILSYEPSPDTFARLSRNIKNNGYDGRILPFNCAVAGEAGSRTLFLHPEISGANTIAPYRENLDFIGKGMGIQVKTVTLGDIFLANKIEFCDYMKMDCEGSEFEILLGARSDVLGRIGRIVLEYHRNPKEIRDKLSSVGFHVDILPTDPTSGFLYAQNENHL